MEIGGRNAGPGGRRCRSWCRGSSLEVLGASSPSGTTRERAPTWRSGSQAPAIRQPSAFSAQSTTRWRSATSWHRRVSGSWSTTHLIPASRPATPSTFGVPPSRKYGMISGWVSVFESPPVPPSRHRRAWPRPHIEGRRCRVGPYRDLWPGKARRSIGVVLRSIGRTPADCAASTRRRAPACRTIGAMISIGWTVPRTLAAWVIATSRVFGVRAGADLFGVQITPCDADPRQRDDPCLLQGSQGPADRVVLEVRSDHVVARLDRPLDGQVQPIGAVEREDPALGALPLEELVEGVPAVVEDPLRGQGHPVARPTGVGQGRPGKLVERLIDGLGLGEAGGGIVEVDHGRAGPGLWRGLTWEE